MNLNIVKGLLIILVIVDHNDFARSVIPDFLRAFSFHVVGFMALPFLRPPMRPFTAGFAQYAFRLYYPFFLLTVALAILVFLLEGRAPAAQLSLAFQGLYSGNWRVLDQLTGLALLWFLPCLIAVLFLRNLVESLPRWAGVLALAAMCLLHFVVGSVPPSQQTWFPLGMLPAVYVIPLAYAIAFLHQRILDRIPAWGALALTATVLTAVKWLQIRLGVANEIGFLQVATYANPALVLLNDLEAISGTLMIFQAGRCFNSRFIALCGRGSMQVYLVHAFVGIAVFKLVAAVALPHPALSFALSVMLTTAFSAALVHVALDSKLVNRFVFPKSTSDLAGHRAAGGLQSARR